MSPVKLGRGRTLGAAVAIAVALSTGGAFAIGRVTAETPDVPGANAVSALPGVSPNTLPAYVPGTRWLVANTWDAKTVVAGTTMATGTKYVYATPVGTLAVPLNLPAGASVWQIDLYGYSTGAATLTWDLNGRDITTGVLSALAPANTSTGPTGGVHHLGVPFPGSIVFPGQPWTIIVIGTSPSAGFTGIIVQYTLPFNVFVPITPARVFDSRCTGAGGKLAVGAPRTVNVKDAHNPDASACAVSTANAVPAGATAVSYNLTITNTNSTWGSIDLLPGTSTTITGSSINWTAPGTTLANGGVIKLGTGAAERKITAVMSGPASATVDFVIDITGYYISES
jgi:hypothetical protein